MPTPTADIRVDEALVRRLLEADRPDLAHLPLRLVANGWDNVVLRLGEDLAVRVPRRRVAAELVRHEQEALPGIARRVPVAVPAPVHAGRPGPLLPFHWSVVPWFAGRTAAEEPVDEARLARDLAAFLAALHLPDPEAPANPVRGVPLADRAGDMAVRLALPSLPEPDGVRAAWAAALEAPAFSGEPLRLHGDLHPANLVVDGGRLVAVIDFGDTTAGDPATDLAVAWLALGPEGRAVLLDGLRVDAATRLRARGWAAVMATALIGDGSGSLLHRIGTRALHEVAGG